MSVVTISESLAAAREKLVVTPKVERSLPAVAAAVLAAVTALMLAGAVILGPGFETGPQAQEATAARPLA